MTFHDLSDDLSKFSMTNLKLSSFSRGSIKTIIYLAYFPELKGIKCMLNCVYFFLKLKPVSDSSVMFLPNILLLHDFP